MADAAPRPVEFGEEFQALLADAYAYPGGLDDLNRLIEPQLRINTIRDLAGETVRMTEVIASLCDLVESRGEVHAAIIVFYVGLPGYAALRAWATRNLTPQDQALVSEAQFKAAHDAYETRRQFGQAQKTAATGLGVLRDAASDDATIAGIVQRFRGMLYDAMDQLQLVNGYKMLHDRLHDLQTKPFARFGTMLLKKELDEADRAEIDTHRIAFTDAVLSMRSTAQTVKAIEPAFDDGWIGRIEDIFAMLDPATNAVTRARLREVNTKLRSALSGQLTNLNHTLTQAAARIPFRRLSELLTSAAAASSPARAAPLTAAADAARRICTDLEETIALHDRWQELDNLLWGFELAFPAAVYDPGQREDIGGYWRDTIVSIAKSLAGADAVGWEEIGIAADGFNAALALEPPTIEALGNAYFAFAGKIRRRFFQVDTALLAQCTSLMELRPSLRALTEEQD